MLGLGREAKAGGAAGERALALIDAFSAGDVYERRLALFALQIAGDGERLLPFTEDEATSLWSMAFSIVPRICDEEQALRALRVAYALRRDRELLRALARRGRRAVVDRYLDWLSEQPGLHDFADLVPLASEAGVRRHLSRALERPSTVFWDRLSRYAPAALAGILSARLREVEGEPDAPTRQRIDRYIDRIVEKAPEAALGLLELLLARGIQSHLRAVGRAAALRPRATLALVERLDLKLYGSPFAGSADKLSAAELGRIAAREPTLLGDAGRLVGELSSVKMSAIVRGWLGRCSDRPAWGFPLFGEIADPAELERAYGAWTIAARDARGVIAVAKVTGLPAALREREARRHLQEVVALQTQPGGRLPYARFLPWDEAKAALRDHLGFPEGGVRGLALANLLMIPGLRREEPELVDRALELVIARKNEQDPVRMAMLQALVGWPREVWRPEHAERIGTIVRAALDAGDLSHGTAMVAELLVVRTFSLDPESGARWLATLIAERGNLYNVRLGEHLSDQEVSDAAPHLLAIAETWSTQERFHQVIQLVQSLGARLVRVPGLPELVASLTTTTPWGGTSRLLLELLEDHDGERYAELLPSVLRHWRARGWTAEVLGHAGRRRVPGRRQPPLVPLVSEAVEEIARAGRAVRDVEVIQALTLLRSRAVERFDAILGELLTEDPSYACVPVVYRHLHANRQDLLDPYLGAQRITGRFATGMTAWILPFTRGFYRWTPAQNVAFAAAHARIIQDPKRDTPTVWRSLMIFAALDSAPMDVLAAVADDPRAAIQERALRVMARCDRGQCVPTLLRCLHDARARIAIYGLRRAVKSMLPGRAVEILGEVPMRKVTVAKEVLRLLGELRHESAYTRLLAASASDLHRDVRIALLRALWDHLDREPTWEIFAAAASGPDWVMAARLGDIPADRLTTTSDARLSWLLGQVLDRPEPEARISLLQRAGMLGIRDPERVFLGACARRLRSPYDDEVKAAVMALLRRGTEDDLRIFPELLRNATDDPRSLHVAINCLLGFPLQRRPVWILAASSAAEVLAADPRWTGLWIRCHGAIAGGVELARSLLRLAEEGQLIGGAIGAAGSALAAVQEDELGAAIALLMAAPSSTARWLAVAALARDAGPGRGWTEERLSRLARLQADPAAEVSGAALAIFPPREMAVTCGGRGPEGDTYSST